MTSTSPVNYKDSYFENPVLTMIHGEPTYETLHHLKNKLKANASSVPTTLGGSNNGYLGTILTSEEYHRIVPNNPFTRPHNPGLLVTKPNGTAVQIASAENNHHLTKKLYLETLLIKLAFIQQIIEASDTKYLADLHNPVTRKITPLVLNILKFLRNKYGWITPPATWRQDHHRQNNNLQSGPTHWHHLQLHRQPVWIRKSSRSRVKSELNNQPCPRYPKQATNIQIWHPGVEAHKKWDNFKQEFREAHLELRKK